jgi:hypothetical protein
MAADILGRPAALYRNCIRVFDRTRAHASKDEAPELESA